MPPPSAAGPFDLSPWLPVIETLENGWNTGKPPRLDQLVDEAAFPGMELPSTVRRPLLEELVKIDMEYRWKLGVRLLKASPEGVPPLIEDYLVAYPAIGPLHAVSVTLIAEECRIRRAYGRPATLDELRKRFGDHPSAVLLSAVPDEAPAVPAAHGVPSTNPTPDLDQSYQLLREIGRGGMATVHRARDKSFCRQIAVKILAKDHAGNLDLERRFIHEAQITGQLQHPGIVPVYTSGRLSDRRPFFAMKLVKGKTFHSVLSERIGEPGEQTRCLRIFEQVCQTVAYAHERGVIHRDLKPRNVMVGSFNEVQVMDWGLAKILGPGPDRSTQNKNPDKTVIRIGKPPADRKNDRDLAKSTRPGTMMGTPAYMAPEQATGDAKRQDERTDVFALGSMLCEILTGAPAYFAPSFDETWKLAYVADLADARQRLASPKIDRRLAKIALTCLAPEKRQRYRTAAPVAREIARWLQAAEKSAHRSAIKKGSSDRSVFSR